MKTTMTALVLGIAIFTVALQGYAEETSTDTESIAGSLSAIRFKNGKVTELNFRDGKVIPNPILHLGEKELEDIDILRLEPLRVELLQLRDRVLGIVVFCPHEIGFCDIICMIDTRFGTGNFTISLDPKGEIEEVELTDGTKLSKPLLNLKEQPIVNVDMIDHRIFTLVEVRDRAKGEVIIGILSN
jgi:hypothetical protein